MEKVGKVPLNVTTVLPIKNHLQLFVNHNNETWSDHYDFKMNILSWKLQHLQKNFKSHNLQCYLIWISWCSNFLQLFLCVGI